MRPACAGSIVLALAALAADAALAQAQAPVPQGPVPQADRSAIGSCMSESANTPRACIGTIAVPCVRQASGDRRDAEIACSRREAAVWRERLDGASSLLARNLASGLRSRFAAVQRSWEGFAAQKCAFLGEVQPPARAAVMQAGCDLTEVAGRAIEVERLARTHAAAASRPRIER